jgi:hypothetical protein
MVFSHSESEGGFASPEKTGVEISHQTKRARGNLTRKVFIHFSIRTIEAGRETTTRTGSI